MKFTLAITTLALALLAGRTHAAEDVLGRADERYAGDTAEVPSFRKHMVPLLGKLGCNGRACHGSFQGQGGFQLSLFGYDFAMDHSNLAAGDEPRVDPSFAENSLAILKPTLEMPHRGGKRMDEGSWEYNLFVRWIEAGAKNVAEGDPEFVRLDVTPSEIRFEKEGQTSQLQVVAVWSDGAREDVTPLCRFTSNGTSQATVDEEGLVTAVEPGDTHVVVFYDNGVLPVPVLQPVSTEVGPKYPKVPTPTKVDELVVEKLRKLGVVPSDLSSDAEFLRRVSLDLVGTLPAPVEIEAFLADSSPDKRARKIDALLETPAYAAWWATKLCDWTGNNENFLNNITPVRGQSSSQWYEWIEHRVANNTPYDEIVEGILLADSRNEGESFDEYCESMSEIAAGKADFAERDSMPYYWARRNLRLPEERVIGFAYTFLGTRMQCAQCHKHPFDQWTKDDFENFQGFFTSTSFGNNPESRDEYDKMVKNLGLDGLRGNDQRRKIADLTKEGKVVPFQELYTSRPRNNAAAGAERQVRQAEQQIAESKKQIAVLQKAGKDTEANKLKVELDRSQRRLDGLVQRAKQAGAKAKLLGGDVVDLAEIEDVRDPLMDWLRDEPLFAKAFVNRVWSGYFNVGIVEPTDDLSLANPPSNAPLLDHLAAGFVAHDFDMKWLHREIANSRTYQLSWVPNETNRKDERNFSHAIPRRLPAEVAVDALVAATASDEGIAKLHASVDGRAIALASPQRNNTDYSLSIFGRNTRESNCDCDRSMEASLLQTVFLRNDDEVYRMIDRRGDGWVFTVARDLGSKFEGAQPESNVSDRARQRALAQIATDEKKAKALRKAGKDKEAKALETRIAAARKRIAPPKADQPDEGEKLAKLDADEIVKQAYLRTLSWPPRPDEVDKAKQYVTEADDTVSGIRDLLWALLNTKEFIVNH
jgi:hypothetical protein